MRAHNAHSGGPKSLHQAALLEEERQRQKLKKEKEKALRQLEAQKQSLEAAKQRAAKAAEDDFLNADVERLQKMMDDQVIANHLLVWERAVDDGAGLYLPYRQDYKRAKEQEARENEGIAEDTADAFGSVAQKGFKKEVHEINIENSRAAAEVAGRHKEKPKKILISPYTGRPWDAPESEFDRLIRSEEKIKMMREAKKDPDKMLKRVRGRRLSVVSVPISYRHRVLEENLMKFVKTNEAELVKPLTTPKTLLLGTDSEVEEASQASKRWEKLNVFVKKEKEPSFLSKMFAPFKLTKPPPKTDDGPGHTAGNPDIFTSNIRAHDYSERQPPTVAEIRGVLKAKNIKMEKKKYKNAKERIAAMQEAKTTGGANDLDFNSKPVADAFLDACETGDTFSVNVLLMGGTKIFHRDEDGCTGLILAAENGHVEVAKLLLQHKLGERGINIVDWKDEKEATHQTALHVACEHGYQDVLKVLVHGGANTGSHDYNGTTPLMLAVIRKDMGMAKMMLSLGKADIEVVDNMGRTALHHCAAKGTLESAKLMMAVGASSRVKDKNGQTPGDYAKTTGRKRVYQFLAGCRRDVDTANLLASQFACMGTLAEPEQEVVPIDPEQEKRLEKNRANAAMHHSMVKKGLKLKGEVKGKKSKRKHK